MKHPKFDKTSDVSCSLQTIAFMSHSSPEAANAILLSLLASVVACLLFDEIGGTIKSCDTILQLTEM